MAKLLFNENPAAAAAAAGNCNARCSQAVCYLAEERTTTNPVADDMNACKELYDMTMEIVAEKDPNVAKLAMPA